MIHISARRERPGNHNSRTLNISEEISAEEFQIWFQFTTSVRLGTNLLNSIRNVHSVDAVVSIRHSVISLKTKSSIILFLRRKYFLNLFNYWDSMALAVTNSFVAFKVINKTCLQIYFIEHLCKSLRPL